MRWSDTVESGGPCAFVGGLAGALAFREFARGEIFFGMMQSFLCVLNITIFFIAVSRFRRRIEVETEVTVLDKVAHAVMDSREEKKEENVITSAKGYEGRLLRVERERKDNGSNF